MRALNALSWWNVYFILVFLLGINQLIEFWPLHNVLLMAALLLPIKFKLLHYLRTIILIPCALALLYAQSYLPGLSAFSANAATVTDFSLSSIWDFAQSVINYTYLLIAALVVVLFLVLQDYVRFTTFSIVGILWLTLAPYGTMVLNHFTTPSPRELMAQTAPQAVGIDTMTQTPTPLPGTSSPFGNLAQVGAPNVQNAAAFLEQFFAYEGTRRVGFPNHFHSLPFDIVLLNICSLSHSDLAAVELQGHELFLQPDITFTNFNSATSYSGPATLRLLRSDCGQCKFSDLYQYNSQCDLFGHLKTLGFKDQLFMDHSGNFGNHSKRH